MGVGVGGIVGRAGVGNLGAGGTGSDGSGSVTVCGGACGSVVGIAPEIITVQGRISGPIARQGGGIKNADNVGGNDGGTVGIDKIQVFVRGQNTA